MHAVLQLALLDFAFERYPAAIEKHNLLLGHYQSTQDLGMQAFVVSGLGDIYRRTGDLERAAHWYECAVPLAAESGNAVVFQMVVANLAELAFAREDWQRAALLYGSAGELAAHQLDAEGRARALERRGLSQERQGVLDGAVESWTAAAGMCRAIGLKDLARDNLAHLERLYERLGARRPLAEVRARLAELETEEGAR
jgi:tetratricopeptide (TPR) repeat protein